MRVHLYMVMNIPLGYSKGKSEYENTEAKNNAYQ